MLLLLADDVGVGDVPPFTAPHVPATRPPPIPLPNLARLANEGLRFTNAHSHPLCSPSRYSLLSGLYVIRGQHPGSTWMLSAAGSQFRAGQLPLGAALRDAGYRTAFFGKVGIGGKIANVSQQKSDSGHAPGARAIHQLLTRDKAIQDGPASWGFDYSLTVPLGIQQPPHANFRNDRLVASATRCWGLHTVRNAAGQPVSVTGPFAGKLNRIRRMRWGGCDGADAPHDGDAAWRSNTQDGELAREAAAFIEGQPHADDGSMAGSHQWGADLGGDTNHSRPFFVLIATAAVHVPHTPDLSAFCADGESEACQLATRSPHAGMLMTIDRTLGTVWQAVRAVGQLDQTLLIFTSDNGGLPCSAKTLGSFRPGPTSLTWQAHERAANISELCLHDSSGGLRGGKGSLYEGGHRVPLIVSWPAGGVRPGTCVGLVGLTDLFATLVDLAGAGDKRPAPQDSISFRRLLFNCTSGARSGRQHILIPGYGGPLAKRKTQSWAARSARWKVIGANGFGEGGPNMTELYDLRADPQESRNLLTIGSTALPEGIFAGAGPAALLAYARKTYAVAGGLKWPERYAWPQQYSDVRRRGS